jgi:hypothetical protein
VSGRGRYARILATPHVPAMMLAAVVARLPIGIDSLAIVLFLRERTGSYAAAGIVSAAFAVGGGAGAPVEGRLIDRFGHRRVLVPLAVLHAGGLAVLVALALLASWATLRPHYQPRHLQRAPRRVRAHPHPARMSRPPTAPPVAPLTHPAPAPRWDGGRSAPRQPVVRLPAHAGSAHTADSRFASGQWPAGGDSNGGWTVE